jgi:FixJ family two-component response regulator
MLTCSTPSSNPPMISIIDDDPWIREAMDGLVRSLGYGAWTFASAEEFLQSDCMNDTACIMTDVQMQGLSGVELQSVLIAQGNCTPIIFMTARPEEQIRRRVLDLGAVGFLAKPYNEARLIEFLQMALHNLPSTPRTSGVC